MSHDINNINQVAMGYLELARARIESDGKLGLENVHYIDKPMEAFVNSSRLINNIRMIKKVRSGQTLSEQVDIGEVLDEVVRHYREVDRKASISYERTGGCFVNGNGLLHDVFSNLVGNAIKHAEGPVEIRIGIDRIDESGKPFYRVYVEDNGSGISGDRKKEIFDRFKRGQTKAKGSGLGLYLVRTIVEGHGGRVWVEDRVPGDYRKGSRFVVMLPAAVEVRA
jgi:signal transduction histidine kinase